MLNLLSLSIQHRSSTSGLGVLMLLLHLLANVETNLGDVTVKQGPVDTVLEHKDSPSKCMFINRKKK